MRGCHCGEGEGEGGGGTAEAQPYTLLFMESEFGPQNHYKDGLLRPNSIVIVHMDPVGKCTANLAGNYERRK